MKTGTIKAIYDKEEYDGKYGHMYVYNMLIQYQGEEKQTQVEIKSKSHPFPLGNGEEINTEDLGGGKVKRVNPNFQGGQGQQQASGGGGNGGGMPKEKVEGMIRTQFIKAAIINGQIACATFADVIMLTDFAITGVIPQERQTQSGNTQNMDDDIPF